MFFDEFVNALRSDNETAAKACLVEGLQDANFCKKLIARIVDYTAYPRKFAETYIFLGSEGRQTLRDQLDWEALVENTVCNAVRNQGYRVFGTLLKEIEKSDEHDGRTGILKALHKICGGLNTGELVENFPQVVRETASYPVYLNALFNFEYAIEELCRRGLIPHAQDIASTALASDAGLSEDTLQAVRKAALASGNAETIESVLELIERLKVNQHLLRQSGIQPS